ncbi:MAG: GIY-YIG nuclease family protein [Patescibacteria group bacterium]
MKRLSQKIPLSPGVYTFIDKKGDVLYVGRAISLRKRLQQYFQKNLDPRIEEMVKKAKEIKFFKTENLLEAIILEANLIKKYWPKYNIKERDDRSFIYIVIPKKIDFPKPIIVRGKDIKNLKLKDENFYIFGPYQSLSLIKNALRIIRRIFPYSLCKPYDPNQKGPLRPCFDYQIGLCPGTCIGKISKEDYQKNIENIVLLLSGKKEDLLKKLKEENPDKIKSLKHIQDVSLITKEENLWKNFFRIEGYDISHLSGKETYGSMVVFINNRPDKKEYRLFKIKEAPLNNDLKALAEVISRRFKHIEWHLPNLILIDGGKPQVNFISKILKEHHINIPLVGISKLASDKLIFPPKIKKSLKQLIEANKEILLKVREEAHRFSLKASRHKRIKNFLY